MAPQAGALGMRALKRLNCRDALGNRTGVAPRDRARVLRISVFGDVVHEGAVRVQCYEGPNILPPEQDHRLIVRQVVATDAYRVGVDTCSGPTVDA